MVKKLIPAILLLIASTMAVAQTRALNKKVNTLTVRVKDNWQFPPVIELNGNENIEIKFDFLDLNVHYFNYSIVHCNADWTPSDLSESEYLDGFNNQPIEDHRTSFNTYMNYTHYRFQIPNDNIKFKLSGNYLVKIYENNDPENLIATACFSLYERQVNIYPTIKTSTDIDYRKAHQQLDLRIDTRSYSIRSPQLEMKIMVNQNNRTDNEVRLNAPTSTLSTGLIFEHVPNLIFEAGNEFRRFEMVTHRYNGLNVEKITYSDSLYHAWLYQERSRANRSYIFDRDQDGRFYIRNSEAQDSNTEADYFIAHFSLNAESPFSNGKLYLLGEFNQYRPDPDWEILYDAVRRQYTKEIPLKQGAYNYQYIFIPDGSTKGTPAPAEGNYFETENEYMVRVYHRGPGERYDKLVGFSLVKSGE